MVRLDLEPDERRSRLPQRDAADAAKTLIQDQSIELDPGTPDSGLPDDGRLEDGDRLGLGATQVNVNTDEVIATLDADTRDYLKTLLNAGGHGLRGPRVRPARRCSKLTRAHAQADASASSSALAEPAREAPPARHEPAPALGGHRGEGQRARQPRRRLGGDLRGARRPRGRADRGGRAPARRAVRHARRPCATAAPWRAEAAPALEALRPAARRPRAGARRRPAAAARRHADPSRPVCGRSCARRSRCSRELRPPLRDLNRTSPLLIRTGRVLNYLANELGHNPRRPRGGLPLLDRLVRAQPQLGAFDRGRPRRRAARPRAVQLLDLPDVSEAAPILLPLVERGGLPMIKQAPPVSRLIAMVVFALSCFSIVLFLWISFGGPVPAEGPGLPVRADLTEATLLTNNADVRISGVTVGRVVTSRAGRAVARARSRWTRSTRRSRGTRA